MCLYTAVQGSVQQRLDLPAATQTLIFHLTVTSFLSQHRQQHRTPQQKSALTLTPQESATLFFGDSLSLTWRSCLGYRHVSAVLSFYFFRNSFYLFSDNFIHVYNVSCSYPLPLPCPFLLSTPPTHFLSSFMFFPKFLSIDTSQCFLLILSGSCVGNHIYRKFMTCDGRVISRGQHVTAFLPNLWLLWSLCLLSCVEPWVLGLDGEV